MSAWATLADALEMAARAAREMAGEPAAGSPMTAKAVAAGLGISTAEVYRQIRLGCLQAIRIGKTVRVPVEAFEAFRKKRTH